METEIKLPSKYSELIRLAIKDLELCENDPRYEVSMKFWHAPLVGSKKCYVCLGGSVISKTLNGDPTEYLSHKNYPNKISRRLGFLDRIRMYMFSDTNYGMYIQDHEKIDKFIKGLNERPQYHENAMVFKSNMLKIADKFEELGY